MCTLSEVGLLLFCLFFVYLFVTPVPSPVQGLVVVSVMVRKLNISWEEPAEPNDYTLNYTVTITDISTGTELSRTLDVDQLTILTEILSMIYLALINAVLNYALPFHSSERNSLQCDCIYY